MCGLGVVGMVDADINLQSIAQRLIFEYDSLRNCTCLGRYVWIFAYRPRGGKDKSWGLYNRRGPGDVVGRLVTALGDVELPVGTTVY